MKHRATSTRTDGTMSRDLGQVGVAGARPPRRGVGRGGAGDGQDRRALATHQRRRVALGHRLAVPRRVVLEARRPDRHRHRLGAGRGREPERQACGRGESGGAPRGEADGARAAHGAGGAGVRASRMRRWSASLSNQSRG